MKQIAHIFKKELKDYFVSPIAYIVISIFLFITGWFFFTPFFLYDQASLRNFFSLLPLIFSFVIPAVSMRLFSEELNVGSYETLLTLPVTFNDIIIGKFLANLAFVGIMLIPTLSYPISISFMGQLDIGPIIGGYIGSIFLGGAFSSISLFASSLTRNQIIAFIIGVAICFALTMFDKILFFMPHALIGLIGYLGADFHFQNISKGIIDSRDILFFVSIIIIGLYSTQLVLDEK
jgi:ABC-2 type transport system permease protein